MKNGPVFFIGLFAALSLSWGAIVLGTQHQLGSLTPYYDDTEGNAFPLRPSGIAAQGAQVYADVGCAACHTQQVRRPDFGVDEARGWGERQSVARDYIYQTRPQLGSLRYGPDLANLAARKPNAPDSADLLKLLYVGSPTHPSYRFLFDRRKIVGERSNDALGLAGDLEPAPGYEVVPSHRAEALVAYLLSLKQTYEYPEARPMAETAAPAPKPVNTEASPENTASNPPGKNPSHAVPTSAQPETSQKK